MLESKEIKKIVESGYDRVVHEYTKLEGENKWPRMKWLNKLLIQIEPGSSVLDLGCGSGNPADVEIAKKHKVTGVDISERQIDLARENVPDGNFIHSDAGSVDFPQNSFDAVVSFYTIEHIPREEHRTILQRVNQWLRPNGFFLISLEAAEFDGGMGEWLGVPMFFSCYAPEKMKQMVVEIGFEILETAIEPQMENEDEVPFLWIFCQKK